MDRGAEGGMLGVCCARARLEELAELAVEGACPEELLVRRLLPKSPDPLFSPCSRPSRPGLIRSPSAATSGPGN